MDISNLKIGNSTYAIKDNIARTNAQNANTKIDGSSITGNYNAGNETLEITFEIGSISNN